MSPESLLSSIASGQRSAEHQLVARYWRGLLYILNKRTKDPQLANDIAQETFLTVIVKARNGEIRNPQAISAFIRQVGVNLVIAHYRKERGHKTDSLHDIQLDFPDSGAPLAEKVSHQKLVDVVLQVIEEMPAERDRTILHQFYIVNTPKQRLCQQLDLSPEHFDRVLYRAKDRLRQILSMKLDVNISETGLSHLLTVTLILSATHVVSPTFKDDSTTHVGDSLPTQHYSDCGLQTPNCNQVNDQSRGRELHNVIQ